MSQAQTFYEAHPFYGGLTWSFVTEQIGEGLRDHYEVPKELPPKLQTLIMKVDAIEENQLLSHSGTSSAHKQMVEARIIGGIKAFPDWFVLT